MKVCVLGARGRMGALFSSLISPLVSELYELDLRAGKNHFLPEDLEFPLQQADLVLLCVHAFHLESVLKVAAPLITKTAVLADITSVKELPMQMMQAYYSGPVVGTHPLFGPDNNFIVAYGQNETKKDFPLAGATEQFNKVAIIQGKAAQEEHMGLVESLFGKMGFATFRCSAHEHDQSVALVQGLNFISHLSYFSLAAQLPSLKEFVTPSFMRRLEAARGQLNEDAELFMGIAKNLPALPLVIDEYIAQLTNLRESERKKVLEALENAKKCYN